MDGTVGGAYVVLQRCGRLVALLRRTVSWPSADPWVGPGGRHLTMERSWVFT
jgi:hypothetical protein